MQDTLLAEKFKVKREIIVPGEYFLRHLTCTEKKKKGRQIEKQLEL
jgi:hypothetical protein